VFFQFDQRNDEPKIFETQQTTIPTPRAGGHGRLQFSTRSTVTTAWQTSCRASGCVFFQSRRPSPLFGQISVASTGSSERLVRCTTPDCQWRSWKPYSLMPRVPLKVPNKTLIFRQQCLHACHHKQDGLTMF
jgi:hypothetical protein